MTLNTDCFKRHVGEHTVEPLLKEVLTSLLCQCQQGLWCWRGEQHPSKNMFLVRGGCLLPTTVHLVKGDENRWESSAGFQIHPLKRKLWRENEQWCLQGLRHKKTPSAQFVHICACISGEMVAEVVTCQWFSVRISLKFPHVQPLPASPSHTWITEMSVEGLRSWWVCMYLCIVFHGLVIYLQKSTAVKEEDKSMRHWHLAKDFKSTLTEMFVSEKGSGIHPFVLQLLWHELAESITGQDLTGVI